jgi:hypothetical protein
MPSGRSDFHTRDARMPLLMVRPWKDSKAGVWHLRQRPEGLLVGLKGAPLSFRGAEGEPGTHNR